MGVNFLNKKRLPGILPLAGYLTYTGAFLVTYTPSAQSWGGGRLLQAEQLPIALDLLIGTFLFFILSSPLIFLVRACAHYAKNKAARTLSNAPPKAIAGQSVFFRCASAKAEALSILSLVLTLAATPLFIALDKGIYTRLALSAFESPLQAAAFASPVVLLLSLTLGLRSWYLLFLYGSAKDFSFPDKRFYAYGFFHYGIFLLITYAAYKY